jgi:hypothetical protein
MMIIRGPQKPLSKRTDKVHKINPVARELKDPKFRIQVIPDKKKNVNTRKEKNGGKDFYANHFVPICGDILRGQKPAS